MNRTIAFGMIAALALLAVAGLILLAIFRPDATATFIQHVVTLLGLLVTAAGTIYGLSKLDQRVMQVVRNTNGNLDVERRARIAAELELSSARERLAAVTREHLPAQLHPASDALAPDVVTGGTPVVVLDRDVHDGDDVAAGTSGAALDLDRLEAELPPDEYRPVEPPA